MSVKMCLQLPVCLNSSFRQDIEGEFDLNFIKENSILNNLCDFISYPIAYVNQYNNTPYFPKIRLTDDSSGIKSFKIAKIAFRYLLNRKIKEREGISNIIAGIYYGISALYDGWGTFLVSFLNGASFEDHVDLLSCIIERKNMIFFSAYMKYVLEKMSPCQIKKMYELSSGITADYFLFIHKTLYFFRSEYMRLLNNNPESPNALEISDGKNKSLEEILYPFPEIRNIDLYSSFFHIVASREIDYKVLTNRSPAFIEHIAEMLKLCDVSVLVTCDMSSSPVVGSEFFQNIIRLKNVKCLTFTFCQFNEGFIKEFKNFLHSEFNQISEFSFKETNISSADFNYLFEGLTKIESIDLSGHEKIDNQIQKILSSLFICNKSFKINLKGTSISSEICESLPSEHIMQLIRLGNFKDEIEVNNTEIIIRKINQKGFAYLCKPLILNQLNYTKVTCDFEKESDDPVLQEYHSLASFLFELKTINTLKICSKSSSAAVPGYLAHSVKNSGITIKKLNLSFHELEINQEDFLNLLSASNVTKLSLMVFELKNCDIKSFSRAVKKSTLEYISLKFIQDERHFLGSQQFCKALAKNKSLKSVRLTWNTFRPNELLYLAKKLKKNTALTELNFSHTEVEAESFGEILRALINTAEYETSSLKVLNFAFLKCRSTIQSREIQQERIIAKKIAECLEKVPFTKLHSLNLKGIKFKPREIARIKKIAEKIYEKSPDFRLLID